MILEPAEPTPDINYANYIPNNPKEVPGLWSAAFSTENDVVNVLAYLTAPSFQDDPNFDFASRAKQSPMFLHNPDAFMGVGSGVEWDYVELKLAQEQANRQVMASSGVSGMLAGMVAGILSPTILLPVGGAIKGGSSVIGAATRTAAWAALGVGLQEGALHLNQDERTTAESVYAIGTAALIGGAFGGLAAKMTNSEAEALAAGMASGVPSTTISNFTTPSGVPQSLSAGAVPPEEIFKAVVGNDPGGYLASAGLSHLADKAGAKKVANALSLNWLGPIARGITSEDPTRRWVTAQFGDAGLYTLAATRGEVTAEGGAIEQLVGLHHAQLFNLNAEARAAFKKWRTETTGKSPLTAPFAFKSYKDYVYQIGQAVLDINNKTGAQHHPIVKEMASKYLKDVFEHTLNEARVLGMPGWHLLKDKKVALRIATQQVRRDLLGHEYTAAQQILKEHASNVMREQLVSNADVAEDVIAIVGKHSKKVELTEDMLDDYADRIADRLMQSLLGNYGRSGIADALAEFGERSAKFLFMDPNKVWSNGRTWGQFLEKDIEKVASNFIRSMSGDIELFRKFRTVDPAKDQKAAFWAPFAEAQKKRLLEAEAIPDEAKRQARFIEINKIADDFVRDLTVLTNRVRHIHGMPADPSSFAFRLGRSLLQLNTLRLMGMVAVSSFADLARTIMRTGLSNTFKHGVLPLIFEFKKFKAGVGELMHLGVANDIYSHGRSNMMFNLLQEGENGTMVERFLEHSNNQIGIIALFDYWTTGMKQFSGMVWTAALNDAIEQAAKGKANKWQTAMLGSVQIDRRLAERIVALNKKTGAEIGPDRLAPNVESWTHISDEELDEAVSKRLGKNAYDLLPDADKAQLRQEEWNHVYRERLHLKRLYASAMKKLVDDTIVTPGLERPSWVDASTPGRLISQFRSYSLSSTTKVAQAMLQDARLGNMAPVASGMAFSLALGALSYYTWAKLTGGSAEDRMERDFDAAAAGDDEAIRRIMDEAINRSGLLGAFAEAQKFAERIPGVGQYTTLSGKMPSRSPYVRPVFDALGPTGTLVSNLDKIIMSLDDPTESTFTAVKQLMPFQNLLYARRIFDWLGDSAMDLAGVEHR